MGTTSVALSIIAGVIHLAAYGRYNYLVWKTDKRPNASTWTIWAIIAAFSGLNHLAVSKNWVTSFLPLCNIAACIGTFGWAYHLKRFDRPNSWEYIAMSLGAVGTGIWLLLDAPVAGNIIFVCSFSCGFITLYAKVWAKPRSESPSPWIIWTVGYIVMTLSIFLDPNRRVAALIYPTSCIPLHLLVVGVALLRTIGEGICRSELGSRMMIAELRGEANNAKDCFTEMKG